MFICSAGYDANAVRLNECSHDKSWNLKLNIVKCLAMRFGGNVSIRLTGSYDIDGVPLMFFFT